MAKEAGLSLERYWGQIIDACFLDDPSPIRRWRETFREIDRIKRRLDKLEIQGMHVEGDGVDLRVTVGLNRRWLGASGHNIPSFEVFTSPDWRGTEGTVSFNEPHLSRYGGAIEGIRLTFERGVVVEATASQGQDMLRAMVASDTGASRVGEFSLTDSRLSRITRFMGSTLYDENRGGPQGNFHIALGNAYKEAFVGDATVQHAADWRRLGFNTSSVHSDIISTARRRATAVLPNGRTKVIYDEGQFVRVGGGWGGVGEVSEEEVGLVCCWLGVGWCGVSRGVMCEGESVGLRTGVVVGVGGAAWVGACVLRMLERTLLVVAGASRSGLRGC